MKKPTPKQIARKTTWSGEDEEEFFETLKRVRSDHARINLLSGRAKSIAPDHPEAAIGLLETILTDYPGRQDYQERMTYRELAALLARTGQAETGAARLLAYAEAWLARGSNEFLSALEFIHHVVEHACTDHYRVVTDLVDRLPHQPPTDDLKGTDLGASWRSFCDAAWCAHLLGEAGLSAGYLEKAKAYYVNDYWSAPDPYRLWLFREARIGSRKVVNALVRPEFTLDEMRAWADGFWTRFRPEIAYEKTGVGERLILSWPEYEVDLILYESPRKARQVQSFMTKKKLGKFETDGARALLWKDAGDYDDPDAINISIELLDFLETDPRTVLNMR